MAGKRIHQYEKYTPINLLLLIDSVLTRQTEGKAHRGNPDRWPWGLDTGVATWCIHGYPLSPFSRPAGLLPGGLWPAPIANHLLCKQ